MKHSEPAVIIHGGAGRLNPEGAPLKLPALKEALKAAWETLVRGKPAIIAVVDALRILEASPYFNAGYGAYPNINGVVLLDVGLMEGTSRDFVALVHVRRCKFPSAVALDMLRPGKTLFTTWTHELAMELENKPDFIKERYGLVDSHEKLIAPYVRDLIKKKSVEVEDKLSGGTVGCVVRDKNGVIASGTSTGGTGFKFNGRIGDSPLIGMGVYADNEICGLSTTGHGETFIRSCFSGFVISECRRALREDEHIFDDEPEKLHSILKNELKEMERKGAGRGGIILIPKLGRPAWAFNSEMLSVAIKWGRGETIEEEDVFIAKRNGDFIR